MMGRSRMGCTVRLVILLLFVAFGAIKFFATTDLVKNPYTGEEQRISLSPKEEILLGLQSADRLIDLHGGQHPDQKAQATVDAVGQRLVTHVNRMAKFDDPINYNFEFHLLADDQRINAFALPGGQIFITAALFKELENLDQLAGVLGHEVGHVICRHSNEQMSKSGLLKSIGTGIGVAIGGGENMAAGQQVGQLVNKVISTKYGREDEYESDEIGAVLMYHAGFNPREILGVLRILRDAAKGARQVEMLSTHPHPENRIERVKLLLDRIDSFGSNQGLENGISRLQ